jgi:hypothetical protein
MIWTCGKPNQVAMYLNKLNANTTDITRANDWQMTRIMVPDLDQQTYNRFESCTSNVQMMYELKLLNCRNETCRRWKRTTRIHGTRCEHRWSRKNNRTNGPNKEPNEERRKTIEDQTRTNIEHQKSSTNVEMETRTNQQYLLNTNLNKQMERRFNNDETGTAQNSQELEHVIQCWNNRTAVLWTNRTVPSTNSNNHQPSQLFQNRNNENQYEPMWTNSGSTSTNFNL